MHSLRAELEGSAYADLAPSVMMCRSSVPAHERTNHYKIFDTALRF